MSERRLLLWLRLLTGAGFMYQGISHILEMRAQADLFAAHPGWQSWPLVGGMRPLELTLWLAFFEFGLGVFLFGGLLTRILGGFGALLAAFQLCVLGLAGGPLNVPCCWWARQSRACVAAAAARWTRRSGRCSASRSSASGSATPKQPG